MDYKHKRVIIAGLDGSFKQGPIGHILELIPRADHYEKFKAVCGICAIELPKINFQLKYIDAPFTIMKDYNIARGSEIVVPGGANLFEPVCRYHYNMNLFVTYLYSMIDTMLYIEISDVIINCKEFRKRNHIITTKKVIKSDKSYPIGSLLSNNNYRDGISIIVSDTHMISFTSCENTTLRTIDLIYKYVSYPDKW